MQLSYPKVMIPSLEGMIYDASGSPKQIETYNNPDDTIPFGRFVAKVAADDDGIKLPSASDDVIMGATVRDETIQTNVFVPLSAIPTMKRGIIHIRAETDVTPDDPVYIRFASGSGGDELGVVRNDSDSGTALLLSNASFFNSTDENSNVAVEINIP